MSERFVDCLVGFVVGCLAASAVWSASVVDDCEVRGRITLGGDRYLCWRAPPSRP